MIVFAVLSAATMVIFISTAGILALAFFAGGVVGRAIGIGRVGAILAPLITGALLDAHWTASMLYVGVGALVLVAGGAVAAMRPAPQEPATHDDVAEEAPLPGRLSGNWRAGATRLQIAAVRVRSGLRRNG